MCGRDRCELGVLEVHAPQRAISLVPFVTYQCTNTIQQGNQQYQRGTSISSSSAISTVPLHSRMHTIAFTHTHTHTPLHSYVRDPHGLAIRNRGVVVFADAHPALVHGRGTCS
jgi:hypothetical protein